MAFWSRRKPVDPAEAKLAHLRQYTHGNLEILTPYPGGVLGIPPEWDRLLALPAAERKEAVIPRWEHVVPQAMRNTILYLRGYLDDIDLLRVQNQHFLLYSIRASESDYMNYYVGGNPLTPDFGPSTRLLEQWSQVPPQVRSFYADLHNGFYHYASDSGGLLALHRVLEMNSIEWGIIVRVDAPLEIDLDHSHGFFSNGGGGYVVIDLTDTDDEKAALWWSDEAPRYNQNFWDLVDEWTVISFG